MIYEHKVLRKGGVDIIALDYERTDRDTYKLEFAGDLLRDEELDWPELVRALQGMAKA